MSRNNSGAGTFYKNAIRLSDYVSTSAALDSDPSHTFWLGGANVSTPQYSSKEIGLFYIGTRLTQQQRLAIWNAIIKPYFRKSGVL